MHSHKKVLPSTYFREISTPQYIFPRLKLLLGLLFFLGNNYFGKKSTPLHGHNFLRMIFSHGLERVFQYLNLATLESVHSIVTFPNRIFVTQASVTRVRLIYDIFLFWSKHLTINFFFRNDSLVLTRVFSYSYISEKRICQKFTSKIIFT